MEACHNDGDPANNRLENLRWDTRRNNHADKLRHGTHNRGSRHHCAKLSEGQALAIRSDPRSLSQIASSYGITRQNVSSIKRLKSWSWLANSANPLLS